MAATSRSAVVQAFLVDHQAFMKLLHEVATALDAGNVHQARQLGEQLDIVAGPHIAFEEAVLYPAIDDQTDDRAFVPQLYDEHAAIVEALARLLSAEEIDEETLGDLSAAFAAGLGHAEHCGTLISRLSSLSQGDQQKALAELLQLRSSNTRWTQLKKGA